MKTRRSIIKYQDKKVEAKLMWQVLEASSWAPSAGNLQSYKIIVTRDKEKKSQLKRAAWDQKVVGEAPVVLVVCADLKQSAKKYGQRGKKLYSLQDATLAGYTMWLKAVELGLGMVWVGAFDEKVISQVLQLKKDWLPVVILPLGYPAEEPKAPKRKPIKELVREV